MKKMQVLHLTDDKTLSKIFISSNNVDDN